MSEGAVIAPVRKLVHVRAPIDHAFDVFTRGLTRWWPHTHGVGRKPIEKVLLEPKLGGRWLEISEDGTATTVATITLWEPPHRFIMLWQVDAHWKPDAAMRSEVDVQFVAEGPGRDPGRTAAPQVRNHGQRGRRVDAAGCRRRLAGAAAAFPGRGRAAAGVIMRSSS